ncbi:hypothetical protein Tsubulata_000875 [Turnera subulata]|uniref:Uncharacterized protein n=1 Tax=Turnera subulata TaxID=218843 RepID=A0A9Q0JJM5_9ROSI|nr:hypothetical protein Tsubulata_000875 [Turnera subulata]
MQNQSFCLLRATATCVTACKKLDGVATWLINGIATVFFTSLERCSSIYINTKDDSDDATHLPFMLYGRCVEALAKTGDGFSDNKMTAK